MSALTTVQFDNTNLEIIDRNGQQWLIGQQIASALGYKDGSSITRIFSRNSDEFTSDMTDTVKLTDPRNVEQTQRIFSPRGAHLIAMFARTDKAKAFRKWVLDVLDNVTQQPTLESQTISPAQQRTIQETVAALSAENKAYAKYYGALKTHFKIAKYDQLLASQFDEALKVLQGVVVEQPAIEPVNTKEKNLRNLKFILSYDSKGKKHLEDIPEGMVMINKVDLENFIEQARRPLAVLAFLDSIESGFDSSLKSIEHHKITLN